MSSPSRDTFAPFRNRDFCLFWIGSFLSGIGSQFTTVAMAWQIYELTDSPLQIGLLGLARAIPQTFLLLGAGLLADAVNRRKLMICTQTGLSCVSAALAIMTVIGKASPALLYLATALMAIFSSLEQPSRQSLVPNLVPREELPQALALQSTQRFVPMIAGPPLAGIILAGFGPAICYWVDAISWLAMLGALISLQAQIPPGGGWRLVSFSSLREGWQFVRGHSVILPLMLLDFGATLFGNVRGLLPIYARDILHVGPRGLGLLYAARATGSLTAATLLSFMPPIRRNGLWILIGVALYGAATALFAGAEVFWFSLLMLALCGAGDTISSILRATVNQLGTPDELRGRMSSIGGLFSSSGPHLGQFSSGAVASWIGAKLSALGGGLATLAVVAMVAAYYPRVRRLTLNDAAAKE